jgi:Zn-dependent metalloprotease
MQLIPLLEANPGITYKYDYKLGYPTLIEGILAENHNNSDPAKAVYKFLELYKGIYGLNDLRAELDVTRINRDEIGAMVEFRQMYKGIPVSGGGMRAFFNRSGDLYRIKAALHPDIDISTVPTFNRTKAINLVLKDLQLPPNFTGKEPVVGYPEAPSASLAVYSDKDGYHLIWVVWIHLERSIWQYLVDAASNAILNKEERPRYIQ